MLTTTGGDLELRIPKLRAGSCFPSLLERRRRVDQALFAVVMEAYLHGVSTRKVDATSCTVRVNRRVVAQAVVVATGVCGDGRGEVLGVAVGDSEDGAFRTQFPRSLRTGGLAGVQLVIADAHLGLCQAVQATMAGAAVQRCRVHLALRQRSPVLTCAAFPGRRWLSGRPQTTDLAEARAWCHSRSRRSRLRASIGRGRTP